MNDLILLYNFPKTGKSIQSQKQLILPCAFDLLRNTRAFLCDVSESDDGGGNYDDYRIVVDLEWSTGEVRDYGQKRGWLIVCELISPFHDVAIAAAGDNKTLIR